MAGQHYGAAALGILVAILGAAPASAQHAGHTGQGKPAAGRRQAAPQRRAPRPAARRATPARQRTPAGHVMPSGQRMPAARTAPKSSTAPMGRGMPMGHKMPMNQPKAGVAPMPMGHKMPAGSPQAMQHGAGMGSGMGMEGMMVISGALKESQHHSQAALQSIDLIAGALQDAQQTTDPNQRRAAMERAQRALEQAREHLGRTMQAVAMSQDVQNMDMNPGAAAPHLGGEHEAVPGPGAPAAPGARPRTPAPAAPGAGQRGGAVAPGR